MNVRKNKLSKIHVNIIDSMPLLDALSHQADREQIRRMPSFGAQNFAMNLSRIIRVVLQETCLCGVSDQVSHKPDCTVT